MPGGRAQADFLLPPEFAGALCPCAMHANYDLCNNYRQARLFKVEPSTIEPLT